jgi:hypothetical protein
MCVDVCQQLGKAVLHYHKSLGTREERLAKEQQLQLRRIANRVARDVKGFWNKINKVRPWHVTAVSACCVSRLGPGLRRSIRWFSP